MTLSRAQRGGLADWWFTVDRVALFLMLGLIGIGLMLAFAASPAATGGPMTAGDFRYALKQIAFALIAGGILGFTSLLSLRAIKLGAAIVFALGVIGSCVVLFTGSEVLGAKRWIDLGFTTLQPSEFLKPSFAILGAAILADPVPIKFKGITLRKELISFLVLLPALVVLARQPDFGQTAVLLALWGALLFFNGLSLVWTSVLGGVGTVFLTLLYLFVPYIHHRVEQFMDDDKTGYQAGLAMKAFEHGGLIGVGPGAGTIKYRIPDAHSDFIFAVAGEEFGIALCGLIAPRDARARCLRTACWGGARLGRRAAGVHQYGRRDEHAACKRHDIAVHLLRRFFAVRRCDDHGFRTLRHPSAAQNRRTGSQRLSFPA
jgi:cell division protein FtsW